MLKLEGKGNCDVQFMGRYAQNVVTDSIHAIHNRLRVVLPILQFVIENS